ASTSPSGLVRIQIRSTIAAVKIRASCHHRACRLRGRLVTEAAKPLTGRDGAGCRAGAGAVNENQAPNALGQAGDRSPGIDLGAVLEISAIANSRQALPVAGVSKHRQRDGSRRRIGLAALRQVRTVETTRGNGGLIQRPPGRVARARIAFVNRPGELPLTG